jgi:hypothetical protein
MNGHYCMYRWAWCVCGCLMHAGTNCQCGCTITELDTFRDVSPTRTGHVTPIRTTHYEGQYSGPYINSLKA